MTKKKDPASSTIALNKKAKFEYAIEERFECGIALLGWEVKALREGKLNFDDSYALLKNNEAFLFGATITPLQTVSTHVLPEPLRTRKLLLKRDEIDELIGAVERKGYTVIPTAVYWKNGKVKVEVGLAKGKQLHDKRATEKERDWNRDKQRVLRQR